MSKKLRFCFLFLIFLSIIFPGCSDKTVPVFSDKAGGVYSEIGDGSKSSIEGERPETVEENLPQEYQLAFVGDIMVHDGQIKAAYVPETDSYSFAGYFDELSSFLKAPDLTVGNLETTFSGKDKRYSGYPQFNAPESLAEELKKAGFDLLTTANNHSVDRREAGVVSTINTLNQWGIAHTGTYAGPEEAEFPSLVEINGLKSVFLSYTYGTNGIIVPKEKSYLVNRIDMQKIRSDIQKAREQGAELVVTCLHFGVEYQRFPGESEKILVRKVAEAGADIIIGTHPHVLQQIENIEVIVDGKPKKVLAAYSLGNFVSGYRSRYKDTGMIFFVKLEKKPGGSIELIDYSYLPVWVHRYQKDKRTWYRVIPVEKGLAKYGQKDYLISSQDYGKLTQAWKDTTGLLGNEKLERINEVSEVE